MKSLYLTYLILALLAVLSHYSSNAYGEPIRCDIFRRLVMSREEAAGLSPAELIARGKEGVEAALAVKQTPYGGRRDEGRRLEIRDEFKQALRREAYRALVGAARGPGADIIAVGNKGHQSDHTALWRLNTRSTEQFPNGAVQDMFGANARDLNLVKLVHDLGKLPETEATKHLRAYTRDMVKGDFLKSRILGHGFDSVARVAELVQREGERLGIPEAERLDAFLQLSDAISWHNYGPVTERAEAGKRYPSLTEAELDILTNAFWPTFFNKGLVGKDGQVIVSAFKDDLGIPAYGNSSDRGVLQKLLTFDDRAALVTAKAPDKIGNQNLKVSDPKALTFNRNLITQTFVGPASQTIVAVKAMGEELRPHLVDPKYKIEDYPAYQVAMEMSGKLKALGESLLEMNSDVRLAAAGVNELQAKFTILYEAKNGNLWKLDGADKADVKASIKIGETWHDAPLRGGSSFDVLMGLIREDGRW
jgi:hypothetical protein